MPDSLHTRSCAFHKDLSAAGILSYIRDDKILLTIKSELFFVVMGLYINSFHTCILFSCNCSLFLSFCVHNFFNTLYSNNGCKCFGSRLFCRTRACDRNIILDCGPTKNLPSNNESAHAPFICIYTKKYTCT